MRMRAAVLERFGEPLAIQELELTEPRQGETLDVDPRLLITGRRVAGSSFGGVRGREEVPKLVDFQMRGEIDVEPFISHRIALEDVNRGFELMATQDGIRTVIEFK